MHTVHCVFYLLFYEIGGRMAKVLKMRICDREVPGSNPAQIGVFGET